MNCKGLYFKGEDIGIRITGTDVINLEELDWELALMCGEHKKIIPKSMAVRTEKNTYTLWIDKEETTRMTSGKWDMQLRLSNDKTHIAGVMNAITLTDSAFV